MMSVAAPASCIFCDECVKYSGTLKTRTDNEEAVMVGTKPNRFVFTVEVTGALSPSEVVLSALQVLQQKLLDFNSSCEMIENKELF